VTDDYESDSGVGGFDKELLHDDEAALEKLVPKKPMSAHTLQPATKPTASI
jgi:hypothetical protein